jgi:hypothetical protein
MLRGFEVIASLTPSLRDGYSTAGGGTEARFWRPLRPGLCFSVQLDYKKGCSVKKTFQLPRLSSADAIRDLRKHLGKLEDFSSGVSKLTCQGGISRSFSEASIRDGVWAVREQSCPTKNSAGKKSSVPAFTAALEENLQLNSIQL